MSDEPTENPEIGNANERNLGAALWLATGGRSRQAHRGRVTALLAAEKEGKISFDGLFAVSNQGRLLGSIWCLNQCGRLSTIWGPGVTGEATNKLADALILKAIEFAEQGPSQLIQCLIEEDNSDVATHLVRNGFLPVTTIDHLTAFPEQLDTVPSTEQLTFVPITDNTSNAFHHLVSQTYESSLDCPELDKLRQIDDVLAGYLASCEGDSSQWYLANHGDEPVGVVLLGHHQTNDQLELIYFGLKQSHRQQGLGSEIVRFVVQLGSRLGASCVVTAVDQRNQPAAKLYQRFGFQKANSKQLLIRPIDTKNMAVA